MKKLGKDLIIVYILTFIGSIFGYFVRILFSRSLSVEQYGLIYSVIAFVFFFMPIRDLGLTKASIYYINKFFAEKKEHLIKTVMLIGLIPQLIMGIIIAGILFLLKDFIVNSYFKNPDAGPVFVIFLAYFAIETFLPTIFHLFAITQDYILMQINSPVRMFLILVSGLIFFKLGFGYLSPALAYLTAFSLLLIIFGFIFVRKYKRLLSYKFVYKPDLIKKMFRYGLPLVFAGTTNNLLAYSDVLLLTYFKGLEVTGYYNVALPSMNVILILIAPVQALLFPIVSREWHRKNKKAISKLMRIIFNNILTFALPFALIFFAFPKTIITVIFGAKYVPAYPALQVLAVFFVFQAVRMLSFSVVAGLGMPKQESKIILIGGIVNVIADLILIPKFSIVGAALAMGLGHLTMAVLSLRVINSRVRFSVDATAQIKTIIAGMIMLGTIFILKYIVNLPMLFEGFVISAISGLIYLGLLVVFGVINKDKIYEARKILGV